MANRCRWQREDDPRSEAGRLDGRSEEPILRQSRRQPLLGSFFGRGIVDPLDDMRVTNPPSNPELLDALAKNLIDNKFSLKTLIKTICKSRTYQLSQFPNEFNKHDKQAYARYYPKRLQAEVLLDALCQVTDSPNRFGGLPTDKNAPNRAIMLPDESVQLILPGRLWPAAAYQRLRMRTRQRGEPGCSVAPAE